MERAEDGMEALAQDIHKWWKKDKSPKVRKMQDLLAIVVMITVMICYIAVIIWVLTNLIP